MTIRESSPWGRGPSLAICTNLVLEQGTGWGAANFLNFLNFLNFWGGGRAADDALQRNGPSRPLTMH